MSDKISVKVVKFRGLAFREVMDVLWMCIISFNINLFSYRWLVFSQKHHTFIIFIHLSVISTQPIWHSWSLFCSPGCKTEEEIAAGGTSAMAFPLIIIVRTSDSTLVLSVRGPFGPLPHCSRSTASDHRSQEGKGPFCGRHWRGRGGGGGWSAWAGFPSYSSLRGRRARRPEDGHSSAAAEGIVAFRGAAFPLWYFATFFF